MNKWEKAGHTLVLREDVLVTRWRKSMSGVAYTEDDLRPIEAPYPKGAISFAILAHEVGHQVLHRKNGSTPRWVEEVEAWEFALREVEAVGCSENVYERVEERAVACMAYSFKKALRRGVKVDAIRDRYPVWWRMATKKNIALFFAALGR